AWPAKRCTACGSFRNECFMTAKERDARPSRQGSEEERWLAGMIAGGVGAWQLDVATNRIEWSPNLEAIHGLDPGSFDGSFAFFQNDIHPDDREHVLEAVRKALESDETYHIEYRLPARADKPE